MSPGRSLFEQRADYAEAAPPVKRAENFDRLLRRHLLQRQ
jgi:hypothetical protein